MPAITLYSTSRERGKADAIAQALAYSYRGSEWATERFWVGSHRVHRYASERYFVASTIAPGRHVVREVVRYDMGQLTELLAGDSQGLQI